MATYTNEPNLIKVLGLYKRQWKAAVLLGVAYVLLMLLSEHFIPHPSALFPASAIALSALFLEGIELWPVVYVAALIGGLLAGFPLTFLIILPIAQSIQAVAGATWMRAVRIDPLFRRSRDIFWLIGIVLIISLILPTFDTFANLLSVGLFRNQYLLAAWNLRYMGTVLCLLILTPFLLRWFAKPRFSRTPIEILETISVFVLLVAIDWLIFMADIPSLGGIPLVYFLLIPLFWIALRLRPRFVTLALLLTMIFAISSFYLGTMIPAASDFNVRLFQTEEFLIVLAIIFFIIVSLEEDRRLNANLLKSQVATLENAVARISSESSAKNDFIAVLAHELRNPLAPVVTAIDLMKLKEGSSSQDIETLTMMEDRMSTVRRLLDDLLDISRISEGKVALKKERIDLETVVTHAVLSSTHHLKERHQALIFKAPEEPLYIQGDAVRIEQLISNLITNASKYSDPGDKITISLSKHGDQAEILVNDTGIGIDAGVIEQIFVPFHQVPLGDRTKKGLGIGLALVKSFVEMHGGTVTASSKGIGKGSEFMVRLPLLHETQSLPHAQKSKKLEPLRKSVEKSTTPQQSPSVLIVDDNDAAAWSMGRLLELKGCSVFYAYDGRQAIEQTAIVSPDIILLDLGLPDQDGYAVAKTIRARGYRGRLIALTGYSTEDAKLKGRDAGFEHYLVKPAGFADLKRAIPEIA